MPSLSAKSSKLQASPIRKLAPHARAAEARGTNVIYLNIGQPDMPTPPEMIAELHGLSLATLAYAPSEGLPVTREAWSAFFASWDIDFAPDEILVTAGASEAITFILSVVAGGGGEVLVFEPCYTNYLSFAAQADVTMVPITLQGGGWLPLRIDRSAAGVRHAEHQGDPAVQSVQSDRHRLYRRGAGGGGPGGGGERSLRDLRRGLPRVRLRRREGSIVSPSSPISPSASSSSTACPRDSTPAASASAAWRPTTARSSMSPCASARRGCRWRPPSS